MRFPGMALALGLCFSLPAGAEEESAREAELFGAPTPVPTDEADREDELFKGPQPATGVASLATGIDDKLAAADDPLAIGGELYLRFSFNTTDELSPEQITLSNPNLLHLYLDSRPNDRVRAFVRGRLNYDFSVREGELDSFGQTREASSVALDQLWLKFDIARTVFVTLGRQPIRWGTGRFWNPTDFLNLQARDPLAIFDERLGVSLLKLHLPLEEQGFNFYAVLNLDGAQALDEIGGALRAELLLGLAELAASVAARKDQPLRLGLDVSAAVWDFDVRLEGALSQAGEQLFWRGRFDPLQNQWPESFRREGEWILQLSAAAEISILYSEQDSLILGAEYFYNDAATDAALLPWLMFQGAYRPFYLGRHYLSGYAALLGPGDWNDTSIIMSGIANLSDGTGLLRLDWRVLILTYLELDFYATVFTGEQGEFRFGFELPQISGAPSPFDQGLSIPAQRLQLGIWLALRI